MTEINASNSNDNLNGDGFSGPSSGSLTVDANGYLISETNGSGANLSGSWTVVDNGEIAAFGASGLIEGIFIGELSPSDTSHVTIGKQGVAVSANGFGVFTGEGGSLNNQGTIAGVTGFLSTAANALTVKNAGLIEGTGAGFVGEGSGPVALVNSGTIELVPSSGLIIGPLPQAISIIGTAHVTNSGTVEGSVLLGLGDDTFTDFAKTGSTIKNGTVTGTIDLGGGTNNFNGGAHAEKVIDDGGTDTVKLGGGNDTYVGAGDHSGGDGTIDGGAGKDTYDASASTSTVFINLGNKFGSVAAHSATGTDIGTDTITKFENADGGANTDGLIGSSGANVLNGEGGADIILGLGGKDVLTGGAGGDFFEFVNLSDSGPTAATRDVITDFSQSDGDRINLSDLDINPHASGVQNFHLTADHGLGGFTHHAGELRYHFTSGDNTLITGDANGDGKADFSIELHGHVLLQASDFIL